MAKGNRAKTSTAKRGNKRLSVSLRTKLYNKYKPPPKTIHSSSSVASTSKATHQSTSKAAVKAAESDSSSSDDDNFVNPEELDLASAFFDKNNAQPAETVPNFDCNAGLLMAGSDSEDDEDDVQTGAGRKPTSSQAKGGTGLSQFQKFSENFERAKSQLQKATFTPLNSSQNHNTSTDISKLLSLGEGVAAGDKASTALPRKRRKKDYDDSDDSDWEEVEGKRKFKTDF